MLSNPLRKKCLFILGMHRSGTSALSGALHLAGMDIGKSIMPPKEDNPYGFFENEKITALNDRILDALFARWHDTALIPANWWNDDLFEEYRQNLVQILKKEFVLTKDILIKDPRISVVLPFYLHVLQLLNIPPFFLICVRDPMDVTASLIRRNYLSSEKIQLLWMDYELKAEYHSRNYPRLFVAYHDSLDDPLSFLETAKTTFSIQISTDKDKKNIILRFVSKELNHYASTARGCPENCHESVWKLYQILMKASRKDLSADELSAVDRIRSEYNKNLHFFNGLATDYKAKLVIKGKNGHCRIIEQEVIFGKNTITADLKSFGEIDEIVLYPCNARVGLQILGITATDSNGNKMDLTEWSSNTEYEDEDRTLVFEVEMPQINIEINNLVHNSEIKFELRYLTFGRMAYGLGSYYRKNLLEKAFPDSNPGHVSYFKINLKRKKSGHELRLLVAGLEASQLSIAELKKVITEKNRRIASVIMEKDKILQSGTWIVGRIITYPIRMFLDSLIRKK